MYMAPELWWTTRTTETEKPCRSLAGVAHFRRGVSGALSAVLAFTGARSVPTPQALSRRSRVRYEFVRGNIDVT